MQLRSLITTVGLAATTALATFTLDVPAAVGTDVDQQGTGPCGGFNVSSNATAMLWPNRGHDVRLRNITDSSSLFQFRAWLAGDMDNWVELFPDTPSHKQGELCIVRVRAPVDPAWYGKPAVFQLSQRAGNGVTNYQCAAVTFVPGPQASPVCHPKHILG
ncbi:hypothetical protein F4780DRAFT_778430 [Xylariomycetidae sp. FL0641]|nr:hypothetical protein F4780DRAFT_778430 [Xylariomycetidae sp. FL0641]